MHCLQVRRNQRDVAEQNEHTALEPQHLPPFFLDFDFRHVGFDCDNKSTSQRNITRHFDRAKSKTNSKFFEREKKGVLKFFRT